MAEARGPVAAQPRFPWEFWLICAVVSLGYVRSMSLGFYNFRLVDLIIDLSFLYFFVLAFRGGLSKPVAWLLLLNLSVLVVRVVRESGSLMDLVSVRTLFGMAAADLACFVFFVARESPMSRRIAATLLATACAIVVLSQAGLLRTQESYVSGAVDLARLLHVQRPVQELDYTETTITGWRALAVGLTFAALVSRTPLRVKALGVIGFVLQFAGGGGGRSALLFAFFAPVVLLVFQGRHRVARRFARLLWAGSLGLGLAGLYYLAPAGGETEVKDPVTHQERVTEIFSLFSGDRARGADLNRFSGRAIGYAMYWEGITSDRQVFWLGTGLSRGAGFADTPNILAHNLVLDVWALSGLVGLLFTLAFLGYVLHDLFALLRAAPARGAGQLVAFAYAASVLYMFQWLLFQAVTADRSFMIVFYLLAGLLRPTTRWLEARRALVASGAAEGAEGSPGGRVNRAARSLQGEDDGGHG